MKYYRDFHTETSADKVPGGDLTGIIGNNCKHKCPLKLQIVTKLPNW